MNWNSIITKLWLVMIILVLLVIGISSATQISFLENIYYQYQTKQLISISHKVAHFTKEVNNGELQEELLDTKVSVVANMIDGNVMIIDRHGKVLSCQGLGISTKDMKMDLNHPHHSPLTQQDLDQLFAGETIINIGRNEYFDTDVLSVGIPVTDTDNPAAVIIIHAPLQPLAGQLASFKVITFYTAMGSLLLATILSLFFSRRVSRPLQDMSRVSLAMASGDFSRQVSVTSGDEIGLLATSLNTLSTQLQDKLAQLKRTDQLRQEFVVNVSHEIKTPLTIMQAFTEALEDDLVTDVQERKEYLHNITEEILRLRRLVNDVLDLKKMEEGHYGFAKEYVDLQWLIQSVANKFNALQEEQDVELIVQVTKVPKIFGNTDKIQQVFINLIDNAIQHTPKGGKVFVSLLPKPDHLMVEVKDTGKGIPATDLPLIWERFYKADKSRTRGQGGTGLGLAIVKNIVEAHGGCINVKSEVGVGTTFTIILPIKTTTENKCDKNVPLLP